MISARTEHASPVSTVSLSLAKRFQLFVSYQRYSALIVSMVAAALWLVLPNLWTWSASLFAPLGWGIRAAFFLSLLLPIGFAIQVAMKWPRKLRATTIAFARIDRGRFSEPSIRHYCEDPCFRVVAGEILRKAGYSREARSETISRFKKLAQEPLFTMSISPDASEPVRVDGVLFSSNPLPMSPAKEQL